MYQHCLDKSRVVGMTRRVGAAGSRFVFYDGGGRYSPLPRSLPELS